MSDFLISQGALNHTVHDMAWQERQLTGDDNDNDDQPVSEDILQTIMDWMPSVMASCNWLV